MDEEDGGHRHHAIRVASSSPCPIPTPTSPLHYPLLPREKSAGFLLLLLLLFSSPFIQYDPRCLPPNCAQGSCWGPAALAREVARLEDGRIPLPPAAS